MNDITKLKYWTYKILPLVYDDSLSYYEVLTKVSKKINELVENNNEIPQVITDEVTRQLNGDYATNIDDRVQSLITSICKGIATDEGKAIFTEKPKQGGELIWLNGVLYKVTAVMTAGQNYIVGTNIEEVKLDDEIRAVKETYLASNNEHWNERSEHDYDTGIYLYWKDVLYVTTRDIKVNDILYNADDNQNLKQITLGNEITSHYNEMHNSDLNLQMQIDGNDGDIENLQNGLKTETARASHTEHDLSTRISTIVAQAGTDNTEVVDGRTWASVLGSLVSPTLGDSIRGQITDVINRGVEWGTRKDYRQSQVTDANNITYSSILYMSPDTAEENMKNLPVYHTYGILITLAGANAGSLSSRLQLYFPLTEKHADYNYYRVCDEGNNWSAWDSNLYRNGKPRADDANNIFYNSVYFTNTETTESDIKNLPAYKHYGILITFAGVNYYGYTFQLFYDLSNPALTQYRTKITGSYTSWVMWYKGGKLPSSIKDANLINETSSYFILPDTTKESCKNLPLYPSTGELITICANKPYNTNKVQLYFMTASVYPSYTIYYRSSDNGGSWYAWTELSHNTYHSEMSQHYYNNTLIRSDFKLGNNVLLFGDSYSAQKVWTAEFEKIMNITFDNKAISGAGYLGDIDQTTDHDLISYQLTLVDDWSKYDSIILFAGLNDAWYARSNTSKLRENIQAVYDEIREHTQVPILFIGPMLHNDEWQSSTAGCICNVAMLNNCSYINAMKAPVPNIDNLAVKAMTQDGTHPNEIGYKILANYFAMILKDYK